MFDGFSNGFGVETECDDDVWQGWAIQKGFYVYAFGSQFEPCIRQVLEKGKKCVGKSSYAVHRETVAVVAAEKEVLFVGLGLRGCSNV